ncbi:hypothetical protein B9Z65_2038 [Elsinoe australis]|uniref:Uncharacterized protein n=1 Tax=Elsinoe australis TaxID=40998 RepID=A0A2P7YMU7_9PEZI|nr:hypothetical protein B9Z65_2038 [Elsinoe australis]
MELLPLLTLLSLASSSAYAASTGTNKAATCAQADVAYIKTAVNHPQFFCNFYNAFPRVNTPFSGLSQAKTTAACKCIIQNKVKTSSTFKKQPLTGVTFPQGCNTADVATVQNEYADSSSFCSYYTNLASRSRKVISNLSIKRTNDACSCIVNAVAITSSTSSASDSTTSTKSQPTTTSTKSTTTTTTATTTTSPIPFCSSSAVQAFVSDAAAKKYCWNVLDIGTPTSTVAVSTTQTMTSITFDVKPSVETSFIPAKLVSTSVASASYLATASYAFCVPTQQTKRDAPAPTTSPSPAALSNEPWGYLKKACSCIPSLSSPPAVTSTTTATASPSTITSTVVLTNTILIPQTTYTETSIVTSVLNTYPYFTTTITTTFGPSPTLVTVSATNTTLSASATATFVRRVNAYPQSNTLNSFAYCNCAGGIWSCGGSTSNPPTIPQNQDGKCSDAPAVCLDLCVRYTISGTTTTGCKAISVNTNGTANGVGYNNRVTNYYDYYGSCSLYSTSGALTTPGNCAYVSSNDWYDVL